LVEIPVEGKRIKWTFRSGISYLVIRVPGYRFRGPGSIPGATRFLVGLERGPLSLVSRIEDLLEGKVAASV
jgi:hypothetical protein